MWKVLPKFGLIKFIVLIVCVLTTSGFVWVTDGWLGLVTFFSADGFSRLTGILTPIFVTFLVILYLLGSFVWKLFWRTPKIGEVLNKKVCPDLNGVWIGSTISTHKDETGNPVRTDVELIIKASFFGFEMSLNSVDRYQRSTVIQSALYKDPKTRAFQLSYIFESVVDQPKASDDSKFDGAAKLNVVYAPNGIELIGTYWTNRGYQRGMQTAGSIQLKRKAH